MSHQLRFAKAALQYLERLYRFLADQILAAAEAALGALAKGWNLLRSFPFSTRLRSKLGLGDLELVI